MSKWITIILTALGMIVGGIFFIEDRFENESDAAETKLKVAGVERVSQEQVETLQSVQRSLESMERTFDLRALESLRNEKYLMSKQLQEDPNNELLKERIERLEDRIEKLENKLYD